MHSGHQRSSSSSDHARSEKIHESKAIVMPGDEAQVASTDEAEKDCILPNGGYGWVCVVCAFLINMHTWGISFAFGVFLDFYLANSIYPSATSLQYALIGGLSISMALAVSPLITTVSRLWGIHVALAIGLVIMTVSLAGASFATELWHLFLSQGILCGWGIGFLYLGSAPIIPQWFSSKRSLAIGIVGSGAGIGGLIYNLATKSLLERVGIAWTFRVLALCEFVTNIICIAIIKDRNRIVKPRLKAFDLCLLKRLEIWLILGWGFLSEIGTVVLSYSLPNYARSVGLTAQHGSIVGALLCLGLAAGRPIVGYLSDLLGRINVAALATGFCGFICLVMWTCAKNFAVLCSFAILAGMVCGTFWSTVAAIVVEVTGLKELPSTLSLLMLCMTIPATCEL
ncbi:MAG: hypothetical protein LQ351_006483 [Letrouitia transgressa]|nr:MAG: hypothetical protein LQ351_006483 [Letrouitia transgressa]